MENKMEYMSMFAIKSREEMQQYLESLTNAQEKAFAHMIFGLTWNMCAKIVNEGEDGN